MVKIRVRMKWMATILGYAYWPLLYFAVYLPFIVPRLDQWKYIPFWIPGLEIIGFIVVLAALGMSSSHKSILFHAFGISLFLQVSIFAMSRLHMPSFLKSFEGGFLPDAILPVLLLGTIIAVLGEAGHFVVALKRRTFNKTADATG